MNLVSRAAAVFLDRDGTLIRDIGYLCREEQLEILPRVPQAIRRLRERGFKVVVITNQSAVGRGRLAETDLLKINHVLRERLAQNGAFLDGIYYCPHHPTEGIGTYKLECECRKPRTGLIFQASKELSLDPSISYVVGDQVIDVELAQRVGAQGIWICDQNRSDKAAALKAHCVADLWEAAEWIIDNSDFPRERRAQR
jgi:D-glycero-D-manno-heptose 1,7-bisphosphate phosphatase